MSRCPTCGNVIQYDTCYVCARNRHDRKRYRSPSSGSSLKRPERRTKSQKTRTKSQKKNRPRPLPVSKIVPRRKTYRRGSRKPLKYRVESYNRVFANIYAKERMFRIILWGLGFSERLILLLKDSYLELFLDELDLLFQQDQVANVPQIEAIVTKAANTVLRQNGHGQELPSGREQ